MTVPVRQVSLIEARNTLNAAVNKHRGGISSRQDEIDLAFAALDIAIAKVLSELTAAEAERDELKAALDVEREDNDLYCQRTKDAEARVGQLEAALRNLVNAHAKWRLDCDAVRREMAPGGIRERHQEGPRYGIAAVEQCADDLAQILAEAGAQTPAEKEL